MGFSAPSCGFDILLPPLWFLFMGGLAYPATLAAALYKDLSLNWAICTPSTSGLALPEEFFSMTRGTCPWVNHLTFWDASGHLSWRPVILSGLMHSWGDTTDVGPLVYFRGGRPIRCLPSFINEFHIFFSLFLPFLVSSTSTLLVVQWLLVLWFWWTSSSCFSESLLTSWVSSPVSWFTAWSSCYLVPLFLCSTF